MVAVLAAVSEEIKSRGGTESNTEYFAALVSLTASAILSCFLAVEHVSYCALLEVGLYQSHLPCFAHDCVQLLKLAKNLLH